MAGTATAVRACFGLSEATGPTNEATHTPRFCMRHWGAVLKGGICIGSVYLHNSIGITSKPNLDLLQEVASALQQLNRPWVLGADWTWI